ncbi:MAG: hypothetical protein RJA59_1278 [Pseudomonadota bacterium]|jgi:hypothetical protein
MRRLCTFPGCDRFHRAKGLCNGHYRQLVEGRPLAPLDRPPRPSRVVTVRVSPAVREALGEKPSAMARIVLEAWAKK